MKVLADEYGLKTVWKNRLDADIEVRRPLHVQGKNLWQVACKTHDESTTVEYKWFAMNQGANSHEWCSKCGITH